MLSEYSGGAEKDRQATGGGAPARQDHGLGPRVALARDASHVWKVGSPLTAVQAVLPVFPDLHTLHCVMTPFRMVLSALCDKLQLGHHEATEHECIDTWMAGEQHFVAMLAAQYVSHQASGVMLRRYGPKPVARHRHHDAAAGSVGPARPHGPVSCERLIGAVLVIDPLHRGDHVSHARHQLAVPMHAAARCSNCGVWEIRISTCVCVCVWVHGHGCIRAVTSKALFAVGCATPSLAILIAQARAVFMRGFEANFAGNGCRQVGHVFLPWFTHLLKQPRQKLCWQGACKAEKVMADSLSVLSRRSRQLGLAFAKLSSNSHEIISHTLFSHLPKESHRDRAVAELHAHCAVKAFIKHSGPSNLRSRPLGISIFAASCIQAGCSTYALYCCYCV